MVVERPRLLQMAARATVEEKKELVGKHREPFKLTLRNTKLRVTPGPNAPQLIRVVKKPFVLTAVRMQKQPLIKLKLEKVARQPYHQEIVAALQETVRVARPRPTARLRAGDRPRPDLSAWLATPRYDVEEVR